MLALSATGSAVAAPAPSTAGQSTTSLRNTSTVSAQSLAQMVAGPKATVSNASVSGKDVQIGTVKGLPGDGNAVTDGVALTSGSLIDADPQADSDVDFTRSSVLGPNHDLTTTGDLGGAGDEALDSLSGADTYDAARLEFDVTATASTFVMFYGFGSEEYAGGASSAPDAWQSRGFKDVLSIQVNGTECAHVPGTQTAVSAASINESSNAAYYTANVSGHTPGQIPVEFNGYTSALPCQASVTPGQKVHVRVAIADAQDGQLDSTVLLRTQGLGFTDKPITDPCNAKAGSCDIPGNSNSNGSNGAKNGKDSATPPGQGKPGVTDYSAASPTTGAKTTVAGLPLTGTQALFLGGIALLLLAILAPLAASLTQFAISRTREYDADHDGAVLANDPLALASALHKLETGVARAPMAQDPRVEPVSAMMIANPFGSLRNLFATHPPMDKRIARLEQMAGY
mgnify:CR=1 FL=1